MANSNQKEESVKSPDENSALNIQVGGAHYRKLKYQPVQLACMLNASPCFLAVAKYFRDKGNREEDMTKAIHFIELEHELIDKCNPYYQRIIQTDTGPICEPVERDFLEFHILRYSKQFFAADIVSDILLNLATGEHFLAAQKLTLYKNLTESKK